MSTANPSKNNIMFNIVFLFLCVFMFIWAALALFGVVPGDVHSLVVLLTPALLGAGFLSRLWPVWGGSGFPFPLPPSSPSPQGAWRSFFGSCLDSPSPGTI